MSVNVNGTPQNDASKSHAIRTQVNHVGEEKKVTQEPIKKRTVSFSNKMTQSTITTLGNPEGSSQPGSTSSQEKVSSTPTKKASKLGKFVSAGIRLFRKREEGSSSRDLLGKAEEAVAPKRVIPINSDGKVLLSLRKAEAQRSSIAPETSNKTLEMDTIEKELKKYFLSLAPTDSTSILRSNEGITKDIKEFIKQKGVDKWLLREITKSEKVASVMKELADEYRNGNKKEFARSCGERLYSAVENALAASLSNPDKPMPHHLRELLQIINYETKKRFPEVASEVTTNRWFFLRYIVPSFIDEIGTLEEMKMRGAIGKLMNDHLQTLNTVPAALEPLFLLSFDQVKQAIHAHLSKTSQSSDVFRRESDEELLMRRWGDNFINSWVHWQIVENKNIKNTINDLLLEFEDTYKNDYSMVPQKVKSNWGEQLFGVVAKAVASKESPLPDELRQLAQAINRGVKEKFPEVDSEKLICGMLFLRFFIPPLLISKDTKLAKISSKERVSVVKCMLAYANELGAPPKDLESIELKQLPKDLKSIFE